MAVADITAHLRRTIISFRNTKRFDTICRIKQVRAVSSLAMSNSAASGRSGHQVGDRAPSCTSMLPRSPMHLSRGLASRAHMKYNKRKKGKGISRVCQELFSRFPKTNDSPLQTCRLHFRLQNL